MTEQQHHLTYVHDCRPPKIIMKTQKLTININSLQCLSHFCVTYRDLQDAMDHWQIIHINLTTSNFTKNFTGFLKC